MMATLACRVAEVTFCHVLERVSQPQRSQHFCSTLEVGAEDGDQPRQAVQATQSGRKTCFTNCRQLGPRSVIGLSPPPNHACPRPSFLFSAAIGAQPLSLLKHTCEACLSPPQHCGECDACCFLKHRAMPHAPLHEPLTPRLAPIGRG